MQTDKDTSNLIDDKFEALSPIEKRVLIAQDVIRNIEVNRFRSSPGCYTFFDHDLFDDNDKELRDVVKDKECEVCAMGGLFICVIDRKDKMNTGEYLGTNRVNKLIVDYLADIFDKRQLALVEIAFEGKTYVNDAFPEYGKRFEHGILLSDDDVPEDVAAARRIYADNYFDFEMNSHGLLTSLSFEKRSELARKRMILIMENIIKNNGTFVP